MTLTGIKKGRNQSDSDEICVKGAKRPNQWDNNPTTMVDPTGFKVDWSDWGTGYWGTWDPGTGPSSWFPNSGGGSSGSSGGGKGSSRWDAWKSGGDTFKERFDSWWNGGGRESWKDSFADFDGDGRRGNLGDRIEGYKIRSELYSKIDAYHNAIAGLKNKQDEYGIHDQATLASHLNDKYGYTDRIEREDRMLGKDEYDAVKNADMPLAGKAKDIEGDLTIPPDESLGEMNDFFWLMAGGVKNPKSTQLLTDFLMLDYFDVDEIGVEGNSVSCALADHIEAIMYIYREETKKDYTVEDMRKVMGALYNHNPRLLNSLPSLQGMISQEILEVGTKALGIKGIWGGSWVKHPETKLQKKLAPTFKYFFEFHKVSTNYSFVGGFHWILKLPGRSDFFDPRTGEYINSIEEVSGYNRYRDEEIIEVAF